MNLVVLKCDVVFENVVPLLEYDFVSTSACLSCNELFQIANGIVFVALDAHLLSKPVVDCDLNHSLSLPLTQSYLFCKWFETFGIHQTLSVSFF